MLQAADLPQVEIRFSERTIHVVDVELLPNELSDRPLALSFLTSAIRHSPLR